MTPPAIVRVLSNAMKPTNTHCAPRESCMSASYCPKNTTYDKNTSVCVPNKDNKK